MTVNHVLLTENKEPNQNVHAQMINLKHKPENVTIVHTDVKHVKVPQTIVLNVLMKTEFSTIVCVILPMDGSKLMDKRNVKNVLSNVQNVKTVLLNVLNVLLTEFKIATQIVYVQLNNTPMKMEYVNHVTTNVQLVQEALIIVILVKISENYQTVPVQKDGIMMEPTPYVNNVYQNVLHVKMVTNVQNVPKKELPILNQNAHAQKVNMKKKVHVTLVIPNVIHVLALLTIV